MLTPKTRKYILILSLAAFVVTAAICLFYSQGYSLNRNFTLSRNGGLYISTTLPNSEIFINNKREKTTGVLNSGLFKSSLKKGLYSILVAKEGFWPWAKTLEVKEGLVAEARAIMVPENPAGEILQKGNFLNLFASKKSPVMALVQKSGESLIFYNQAKDLFLTPESTLVSQLLNFKNEILPVSWEKNTLIFKSDKGFIRAEFNLAANTVSANYETGSFDASPSIMYERFTDRDREKVWWNPSTNQIFINWLKESDKPPYYICEENCDALPLEIFQTKFRIKNIEFFPQRKDVIIVAVGNGVYALETDGRGGRLIYPIYKGKEPTFALSNENDYIYVLDDGSLLKMYIK